MSLKGKLFKFNDNVNTDEIIAARYLNTSDPQKLVKYFMEDIRPGFSQQAGIKGGIIVAGENFGCGSSREHAPIVIKHAGISCVIAQSFARIFLRNAINIGLSIIELKETGQFIENDEIQVDLSLGCIKNLTQDKTYTFLPYPDFLKDIIEIGGWLKYARTNMEKNVSDYLQDIAQFPYKTENKFY